MTTDNYHDDDGLLFNKLGISDPRELHEYDLLAGEIHAPAALAYAEAQERLGMATLNGIHEILFGELYEWAGRPRGVPLYKGESRFADPDHIEGWLDATMRQFERAVGTGDSEDDFRRFLGELWGRLNWLHPYPEGNGRATQIFVSAVALRYGYEIDWGMIARSDELEAARESVTNRFGRYQRLLWQALHRINGGRTVTGHYPDRSR
ncbi:MAG: Fic/DOC family protein [Hyphomicrobiaceae bacterium]|uniref:Fic/DOC family protein n=1 Tax=Bradyrhizobium sp. TaxID=376 RepID=UPI003D13C128